MGSYRSFIPKFAQVAWPLHELTLGENAGKKKAAIMHGMTGVSGPLMTWSTCTLQCLFLPMLISKDLFSSILTCLWVWLGGCPLPDSWWLYWCHHHTMLVGVWQRLNLTNPAHKLEFLTLKWAVVEKFHKYLYRLTFDVYTDNNPLTYVSNRQPSWMLQVTHG